MPIPIQLTTDQLRLMIYIIAGRVDELAKPAGKGKKKPSPRLVELAGDLKATKEALKARLPEASKILDGLLEEDASIDWPSLVGSDLFEVRPNPPVEGDA